ncbi:unnamed protein product [Agarophyton chilense]
MPPLLTFSELLEAQLDETLPYPILKRLLRTLKQYHPAYPVLEGTASHFCSLSQTQTIEAGVGTHESIPKNENQHIRRHVTGENHRSSMVQNEARLEKDVGSGDREVSQNPFRVIDEMEEGSGKCITIFPPFGWSAASKGDGAQVFASLQTHTPRKRNRPEISKANELDSGLKKKRRQGRRRAPPIPSSSDESEKSSTAHKENKHLASNLKRKCALRSSPRISSKSRLSSGRVAQKTSLFLSQVGEQINMMLCELIRERGDGEKVTWSDVRQALLERSPKYTGFCVALDKQFVPSDSIALCRSPQNSQSSKGSKSTIFYSNTFWNGVWKDYLTSAEKPPK